MAGEAAEALAGRSMSAAEGRLKSRLDTLSDDDRRAVEDAVATHPDPPNRGGPFFTPADKKLARRGGFRIIL